MNRPRLRSHLQPHGRLYGALEGAGSRKRAGGEGSAALWLGSLLWLTACAWPLGLAGQGLADSFQHRAHEGLFPLCAGCHVGAGAGGVEAPLYPEPSLCVGCHDGVAEERVDWDGPTRSPSNLAYEHREHEALVRTAGDDAPACGACHSEGADAPWNLAALDAARCWTCHESSEHFVGAGCATCHVPLAETRYTGDRVAALPSPPQHEGDQFLLVGHGSLAVDPGLEGCTTCHTRERCLGCHVVETDLIGAVPPAPPTLEPVPVTARYPAPSSHAETRFGADHSVATAEVRDECGSCHTRNDCLACHVGAPSEAITALPEITSSVAPGAQLVRSAPASHEQPFFDVDHAMATAAGACATCHLSETCTSCHAGPTGGGFHPTAFTARHAAEAFTNTMECTNCHNTAAFCRECHASSGLSASGRLESGYHDAEPLWLLRHGQAARQGLEGCASCHQQRDCVQCHSSTGAFRVSPHGPDFDAERAWARSAPTCRACHIGDPRGGGT